MILKILEDYHLNKKEFILVTKEKLMKWFGEGTEIRLQEVRKNNNVILQGILIQKPGSNISPTIYIDEFYEMYEDGVCIDEIVERIIKVYERGEVKTNIDMEFFRDFEQVKDRIVYRLINADKNQELLKNIPHILFLDLAICFYYAFYDDELGEGMILIHNSHMEMWQTNHQELMRLAQRNTSELFEPVFITLDSVIENMYVLRETEPEPNNKGFFVVTNKQKNQGAACILYSGMLERLAEKLDGSYYMIPSSIHEVIVFRDTGETDVRYLQEIIEEANTSQVMVEDVLSDHPYYYDRIAKKLLAKKVF